MEPKDVNIGSRCWAPNPSTATECERCHSSLTPATTGKVQKAEKPKRGAAVVTCPYCGTPNRSTMRRCKKCDRKLPASQPMAEPDYGTLTERQLLIAIAQAQHELIRVQMRQSESVDVVATMARVWLILVVLGVIAWILIAIIP